MNQYEESELEGREICCEQCGKLISVRQYDSNEGLCDECAMIAEMHGDSQG